MQIVILLLLIVVLLLIIACFLYRVPKRQIQYWNSREYLIKIEIRPLTNKLSLSYRYTGLNTSQIPSPESKYIGKFWNLTCKATNDKNCLFYIAKCFKNPQNFKIRYFNIIFNPSLFIYIVNDILCADQFTDDYGQINNISQKFIYDLNNFICAVLIPDTSSIVILQNSNKYMLFDYNTCNIKPPQELDFPDQIAIPNCVIANSLHQIFIAVQSKIFEYQYSFSKKEISLTNSFPINSNKNDSSTIDSMGYYETELFVLDSKGTLRRFMKDPDNNNNYKQSVLQKEIRLFAVSDIEPIIAMISGNSRIIIQNFKTKSILFDDDKKIQGKIDFVMLSNLNLIVSSDVSEDARIFNIEYLLVNKNQKNEPKNARETLRKFINNINKIEEWKKSNEHSYNEILQRFSMYSKQNAQNENNPKQTLIVEVECPRNLELELAYHLDCISKCHDLYIYLNAIIKKLEKTQYKLKLIITEDSDTTGVFPPKKGIIIVKFSFRYIKDNFYTYIMKLHSNIVFFLVYHPIPVIIGHEFGHVDHFLDECIQNPNEEIDLKKVNQDSFDRFSELLNSKIFDIISKLLPNIRFDKNKAKEDSRYYTDVICEHIFERFKYLKQDRIRDELCRLISYLKAKNFLKKYNYHKSIHPNLPLDAERDAIFLAIQVLAAKDIVINIWNPGCPDDLFNIMARLYVTDSEEIFVGDGCFLKEFKNCITDYTVEIFRYSDKINELVSSGSILYHNFFESRQPPFRLGHLNASTFTRLIENVDSQVLYDMILLSNTNIGFPIRLFPQIFSDSDNEKSGANIYSANPLMQILYHHVLFRKELASNAQTNSFESKMKDFFDSFSHSKTFHQYDFFKQQDPCKLFDTIYSNCTTSISKLFILKWNEKRIIQEEEKEEEISSQTLCCPFIIVYKSISPCITQILKQLGEIDDALDTIIIKRSIISYPMLLVVKINTTSHSFINGKFEIPKIVEIEKYYEYELYGVILRNGSFRFEENYIALFNNNGNWRIDESAELIKNEVVERLINSNDMFHAVFCIYTFKVKQ